MTIAKHRNSKNIDRRTEWKLLCLLASLIPTDLGPAFFRLICAKMQADILAGQAMSAASYESDLTFSMYHEWNVWSVI